MDRQRILDSGSKGKHMKYVGFGARQIASGIHLMTGCFHTQLFGDRFHTHLSAYLVCGGKHNILVDTGHPKDFPKVVAYVKSIIGEELTYIFPTHEEYPHAGSLGMLLDEFPKALVVGETRNFHLYFPNQYRRDRFIQMNVGDNIELGGRKLWVLPAPIHDLPASYWAYDDRDQALFVSDGFAFSHHENSECMLLSNELLNQPTADNVRLVLDLALYWSRYADNGAIVAQIHEMLETYETKLICPAHGGVITSPVNLITVMIEALMTERI
jgi:flavorubredoxin